MRLGLLGAALAVSTALCGSARAVTTILDVTSTSVIQTIDLNPQPGQQDPVRILVEIVLGIPHFDLHAGDDLLAEAYATAPIDVPVDSFYQFYEGPTFDSGFGHVYEFLYPIGTDGALTGVALDILFQDSRGVPAIDVGGQYDILIGIPEPATWALMLVGFGGLGVVLRRQRPYGVQFPVFVSPDQGDPVTAS